MSDGELSDSETITITVVNVNQTPSVTECKASPRLVRQGQQVYFMGNGSDSDGQVVGYNWRSSRDGELSTQARFRARNLSVGQHTIYFKVQDNEGAWSEEVAKKVTIKSRL